MFVIFSSLISVPENNILTFILIYKHHVHVVFNNQDKCPVLFADCELFNLFLSLDMFIQTTILIDLDEYYIQDEMSNESHCMSHEMNRIYTAPPKRANILISNG